MDFTHDPSVESWVESANDPNTDFPLQNLPFGIFRRKGSDEKPRAGVGLGESIIDLTELAKASPFEREARRAVETFTEASLNQFMACGRECWGSVRRQIFELFRRSSTGKGRANLEPVLIPMNEADMLLPVTIGDYTDFYASVYHATNVGKMLRPDNPILPNYKYVPIAYHGRTSSIAVSGTTVIRPSGQTRDVDQHQPSFGPTRLLDYELELGMFIGRGTASGKPIPIDSAREHIFGFCLLNDWSARDIQKWEYQPLGPFLAKNFATTISPWIVTADALEPFRGPAFQRGDQDPPPLSYLSSEADQTLGGLDIHLEVYLSSSTMRATGVEPVLLSRSNSRDLYWTVSQMITHHSSNGCNLRPGDLFGSGTVSGKNKGERGCLLELTWRGKEPVALPTGETRKFLEDGDEVIFRGWAQREGAKRIGFGVCRGIIVPGSTEKP